MGGKACAMLSKGTSCNRFQCPVDCKMNQWSSAWSTCSDACGGGVQFKHRSIITAAQHGGVSCDINALEKARNCNSHPCPVDCVYEFQPWNECSKSCKTPEEVAGIQWKYVVIMQEPMHGGDECPIKTARTCNTQACPTFAPTPSPTKTPTPPPTPAESTPVFHKGATELDDVDRFTVEATRGKPKPNSFYTNIACKDEVWGDLSKVIKSSGVSVNYANVGRYSMVFTCTNPAPWRRTAQYSVVINVQDTTNPICKTKGVVHVEASFPFSTTAATCVDNIDGVLKVQTAGIVDVEKAGTYEVVYYASDKSGNVGKFVQHVKVVDTLKPVIGLKVGDWPTDGVGIKSYAGDLGINGEANPVNADPNLMGYEQLYPVRRRLVMARQAVVQSAETWAFVAAIAGVALVAVQFRQGQVQAHVSPSLGV
jgi:hypothetical protein